MYVIFVSLRGFSPVEKIPWAPMLGPAPHMIRFFYHFAHLSFVVRARTASLPPTDADAGYAELGGHLPIIESRAENQFVSSWIWREGASVINALNDRLTVYCINTAVLTTSTSQHQTAKNSSTNTAKHIYT